MLVLGIDVGTQGARSVVCDETGRLVAQADRTFAFETGPKLTEGWIEQDPNQWWAATTAALREVVARLREQRLGPDVIRGVAVTSTSGTVCVVDDRGGPLRPAMMYNDRRSEAEAAEANQAGAALAEKLGYRFASSFALPKLLWLKRHEPATFGKARYFLSPTDFIAARLCPEALGVTDHTNALKTGYDLIEQRWPAFCDATLGLPVEKLPRVVKPGAPIGAVSREAEETTGLAAGTPMLAGMTDGCASQVATGAIGLGQWNSTLGTTLVIKGVTRDLIRDPAGRVYCHRHPDGHWLPGGASNTGGECIARKFDPARLDALGAQAAKLTPTDLLAYPLMKKGERFPFAHPAAEGFVVGDARDEAALYTAYLEGVGYVERLAYDVLRELGAEIGGEIHGAGGATKAATWLQIRADILQKTLLVPGNSGGAMGAAIIAAGGTIYDGIVPAAQAMVRIAKRSEPRPGRKTAYEDRYARFREALRQRGYIG